MKTIKAFSLTMDGFPIPVANLGEVKIKGIIVRPFAIFGTIEEAEKIQNVSTKKSEIKEIEIKIL